MSKIAVIHWISQGPQRIEDVTSYKIESGVMIIDTLYGTEYVNMREVKNVSIQGIPE